MTSYVKYEREDRGHRTSLLLGGLPPQSSPQLSYNSLASTASGSTNTTLQSPSLKTPLKKRLKCHEQHLGRGLCNFILHTNYCEQHSLGGRTVDSV